MKKIFWLLLLGYIFLDYSYAQKRIYTTKKIVSEAPFINGILDDDEWKNVAWSENFVQHQPYEGKKPYQRSAFKILYNDNFLYVGIQCYDENPDSIEFRLSRRDDIEGDDVAVIIDSYFDHQTAFGFFVSSAGVKADGIFTNNGDSEDFTWDPIWHVKTSRNIEGWCAEMKIPLSQLRFENNQKNMIWGLQVGRNIFRKQELSLWQAIPRDAPGFIHLIGELHGIKGIHPKKQIEIAPYTVAKVENYAREEGNPFDTGRDYGFNAGVDGKIGVTNNLTLDFSINPDFGQVEADPSEVNLSAFETYFEEKRPFFIEGKNIFNYNLAPGGPVSRENLFYSRRIGRRPQHEPEIYDYIDSPENTPILGAFKLSGKTKNGWSIGLKESFTSKVKAELDIDGSRSHETVEPYTNYFVGSLQKDINKGNTIIGGMFTATKRNIKNPNINLLHDDAYTGGFNFRHNWKERTYFVGINLYMSHVKGTPSAITETQTSSARYFQRPDANYLNVDSSRTSLTGSGGNFNIGKGNGKFQYGTFVTWKSPELELNDIGYMRQADDIRQIAWINYRITEPFSIFRSLHFNAAQWASWDFGGTNTSNGAEMSVHMNFINYWDFGTGFSFSGENFSNSDTRGGPSLKRHGGIHHFFYIGSDHRKKITSGMSLGNFWGNQNSSRNTSARLRISYRPINALTISITPRVEFRNSKLQYVTDENNHYIFASINQKTINTSIRINYSITPDLSIQYWGQPFISAGKYSDYKEITDPDAEKFDDLFTLINPLLITEIDNSDDLAYRYNATDDIIFEQPSYSRQDFLSNLVARWEYTPGSTVYLVWSQGRYTSDYSGRLNYDDKMRTLFKSFPHNIFLVKFSYRFKE